MFSGGTARDYLHKVCRLSVVGYVMLDIAVAASEYLNVNINRLSVNGR